MSPSLSGRQARQPPRALLLLGLLVGCRDLPEPSYETEHLLIGTNFDTPLCRGNLDRYERIVTTAEATLGTQVDGPIELYLWDGFFGTVPDWCPDDLSGCYRGGKVYSSLFSAEHELVHPVVDSFAAPRPFWSEGVAEALQTERTKFHASAPSDSIDAKDSDGVNYMTAGHFSRWVLETRGLDKYRELLRAKGDAREAFESTYGLLFEDAEQQYIAEAPDSYGAFISCEELPLESTNETSWSEMIDLACSEVDVFSDFQGLYAMRIFTVVERGDYSIATTGTVAALWRCAGEDYEIEPSFEEVEVYGDVPAYTAEWPTGYVKGLGDTSQPTVLDLTPGRYTISAGFEGFDARALEIAVEMVP